VDDRIRRSQSARPDDSYGDLRIATINEPGTCAARPHSNDGAAASLRGPYWRGAHPS
jgi:hypothetical protein